MYLMTFEYLSHLPSAQSTCSTFVTLDWVPVMIEQLDPHFHKRLSTTTILILYVSSSVAHRQLHTQLHIAHTCSYTLVSEGITMHMHQCFIQRVRTWEFPTPQLKFPSSTIPDFCHNILALLSPPREHYVLYLAISKIMILYETLHTYVCVADIRHSTTSANVNKYLSLSHSLQFQSPH